MATLDPTMPSQETLDWLRANYTYDPDTGLLQHNRRKRPVTGTNKSGYVVLHRKVNNKPIANIGAHHAAWYLHYGEYPTMEMDHINRIRSDNRIQNLRRVTHSENNRNRVLPPGTCVTMHKHTGKWQAQVWNGSKMKYLGLYPTRDEAIAASAQYKALQ